MAEEEGPHQQWFVTSLYGARTKHGLVQVRIGDHAPYVMSAADARRVGLMLVDAAHAADGDEFLMHFLQEDVEMPLEKAAAVLAAFRQARTAYQERA